MRTYDLPFSDWIGYALHKKTLAEVMEVIRKNKPLETLPQTRQSNRKYMAKILREEIFKQFSEQKRPMLETVLNSVDARPSDFEGDYDIKIKLSGSTFTASDNGKGMDLEDILKLLIIPFNTEKSGIEEIGRFGVGFLSTLNYCTKEPRIGRVRLETGTDKEGYLLEFYSTSGEAEDIRMRVKKKSPRKGTKVKIKTIMPSRGIMADYLGSFLEGVPSYKSRIFFKRRSLGKEVQINDDSENKWYTAPVEVDIFGKIIKQRVGFRGIYGSDMVNLTSQGVLVKSLRLNVSLRGCTVSFPPAARVVEGRDEFKIDENYGRCLDSIFVAIEEYAKDQERSSEFTERMADLIPDLASAFEMKSIKDVKNLERIIEVVMPGKKYCLRKFQIPLLAPFIGPEINDLAFTASPQSGVYWAERFGGFAQVLKDFMTPKETFSPEDFYRKFENASFYPNLHLLAKEIVDEEIVFIGQGISKRYLKSRYKHVHFVEGKEDSPCPVFSDKASEDLYINVNHRDVRGNLDLKKVYAVVSDYYYLNEAQIDIVKYRNGEKREQRVLELTGQLARKTDDVIEIPEIPVFADKVKLEDLAGMDELK